MTTDLVKGQNLPWPDHVVTVRVHHPGDVSALLLGADEKVRSSADLAFYNQPVAGAATWSPGPPQQVHVALDRVDPDVTTVLVVVSTDPGRGTARQRARAAHRAGRRPPRWWRASRPPG